MPYWINEKGEVVRTKARSSASTAAPSTYGVGRPILVTLISLICGLISLFSLYLAFNYAVLIFAGRALFFGWLALGLWRLRAWARWLTLLSAVATLLNQDGGFWVTFFSLTLPELTQSVNAVLAGIIVLYLLFSRVF